MSFKYQLQEKLSKELNKRENELLPSGYQALGEICIVNLNEKLLDKKKKIGEAILKILPRFKVIYNKKGEIKGKFREPQVEFLAGNKEIKEARVIENNCIYSFDVTKLMFAKGNINERIRIAKQVKKNEVILDMFAGIGYFTIPIGKLSLAKKICSIELNPIAFEYLNKNIKLNNITNVETINGNNIKEIEKLKGKELIFNRIVMGYLPPPMEFVGSALSVIKKGIIHYEALLNEDNLEKETEKVVNEINEKAKLQKKKAKLLKINFVKGYKPHINHYVLDLEVC